MALLGLKVRFLRSRDFFTLLGDFSTSISASLFMIGCDFLKTKIFPRHFSLSTQIFISRRTFNFRQSHFSLKNQAQAR